MKDALTIEEYTLLTQDILVWIFQYGILKSKTYYSYQAYFGSHIISVENSNSKDEVCIMDYV
jgi:hypothetical protein